MASMNQNKLLEQAIDIHYTNTKILYISNIRRMYTIIIIIMYQ